MRDVGGGVKSNVPGVWAVAIMPAPSSRFFLEKRSCGYCSSLPAADGRFAGMVVRVITGFVALGFTTLLVTYCLSECRGALRNCFPGVRLFRLDWFEIFRKLWNGAIVIAVAAIIVNQVALSYMMFRLWPLIEKLSSWV